MPAKLTTEQFLSKARAAHGTRYDYSETVYLPMPQKIAIRCPQHGIFMQKAGQHLSGKGCPWCGAAVLKTKITALGKSRLKWDTANVRAVVAAQHPGLDLSQLVYTGNAESGAIICQQHGASLVPFVSLLKGRGCRRCAYDSLSPRVSREEWLNRFAATHGTTYAYGAGCIYNYKPITIICSTHGEFKQRPDAHVSGAGCPKCAHARRKGMGREAFLRKFRATHGNQYQYTALPEYFTSKQSVPIECKVHGVFFQLAFEHSKGQGCPQCADESRGKALRLGREAYLDKFSLVHGSKYTYLALPAQFLSVDKIEIECSVHGTFSMVANTHAQGAGCSKCAHEKNGRNSPGWRRSRWIEWAKGRVATLYCLRLYDENESFYKVGITMREVSVRFRSGVPYRFEVIAVKQSTDAASIYDMETSVHRALKAFEYTPRKKFDGRFECFSSIPEDILRQLKSPAP